MLASFNEMDYKIVSKLGKRMSAASWGIRFAASQKNVDIVLSGMNSLDQIQDNVSYMKNLEEIIYVFLTIFLYLLKCPQSLIL